MQEPKWKNIKFYDFIFKNDKKYSKKYESGSTSIFLKSGLSHFCYERLQVFTELPGFEADTEEISKKWN